MGIHNKNIPYALKNKTISIMIKGEND